MEDQAKGSPSTRKQIQVWIETVKANKAFEVTVKPSLDNPRPRQVQQGKPSFLRKLRRKLGGTVADIFTW
jgi:hypothetical protein